MDWRQKRVNKLISLTHTQDHRFQNIFYLEGEGQIICNKRGAVAPVKYRTGAKKKCIIYPFTISSFTPAKLLSGSSK